MFGIEKILRAPAAPPPRMEPKAAAVLAALREADGETVARGALLDRCWPHGEGSDEALTQAVAQVRRALADSPARPRFVATIPRVGYRWVAGDAMAMPLPPKAGSPRLAVRVTLAVALLAIGGAATLVVSRQFSPQPKLQVETEVRLINDGKERVVRTTGSR